jgi:hypothetical protein
MRRSFELVELLRQLYAYVSFDLGLHSLGLWLLTQNVSEFYHEARRLHYAPSGLKLKKKINILRTECVNVFCACLRSAALISKYSINWQVKGRRQVSAVSSLVGWFSL